MTKYEIYVMKHTKMHCELCIIMLRIIELCNIIKINDSNIFRNFIFVILPDFEYETYNTRLYDHIWL